MCRTDQLKLAIHLNGKLPSKERLREKWITCDIPKVFIITRVCKHDQKNRQTIIIHFKFKNSKENHYFLIVLANGRADAIL